MIKALTALTVIAGGPFLNALGVHAPILFRIVDTNVGPAIVLNLQAVGLAILVLLLTTGIAKARRARPFGIAKALDNDSPYYQSARGWLTR